MRAHGTYACYVWGHAPGPGKGCRCEDCKAANRAYERERVRRATPAYVGADRARGHISWLRQQGIGLKQIAKASGVSHGGLTKLIYGVQGKPPSKRIRKSTEDAILAVTVNNVADGARVDASGCRADIATLVERGWSKRAIADAIGVTQSNLMAFTATVSAAKARRVHALLDEPVPPRRSRWGVHEVAQPQSEDPRERARKAAEAERRAAYRAKASDDRPPTIDPDVFLAPWRQRAACRLLAPEDRWIFWPGRGDGETVVAAKAVCATCPVSADCLAYAIEAGELGVWGGTSTRERRQMRRAAA